MQTPRRVAAFTLVCTFIVALSPPKPIVPTKPINRMHSILQRTCGRVFRPVTRIFRACLSSSAEAANFSEEVIQQNICDIKQRVAAASSKVGTNVELLAVSKTKPVEMLRAVHAAGHTVFGENYVQELIEKAPLMPDDTKWHFIGKLQSNKANSLVAKVPNLKAVHTVHSEKLANKLAKACVLANRTSLDVYVQVDTSNEATKNGVKVGDELSKLAKHVNGNEEPMSRLNLVGLMTIGAPGDTASFATLVTARDQVAAELGLPVDDLKLSMGMSGDFEQAIEYGANVVRVGSTIFGARDYSKK